MYSIVLGFFEGFGWRQKTVKIPSQSGIGDSGAFLGCFWFPSHNVNSSNRQFCDLTQTLGGSVPQDRHLDKCQLISFSLRMFRFHYYIIKASAAVPNNAYRCKQKDCRDTNTPFNLGVTTMRVGGKLKSPGMHQPVTAVHPGPGFGHTQVHRNSNHDRRHVLVVLGRILLAIASS